MRLKLAILIVALCSMPVLAQTHKTAHKPVPGTKLTARVNTTPVGPTVSLWWNPETAAGFNLYRSTTTAAVCPSGAIAGPPIASVTAAPTAASPYVDSTVTFGVNYCYTVTAFNTATPCTVAAPCESQQETPYLLAQTPPNPTPPTPTGLTLGTITAQSVPLRWTPPAAMPGVTVEGQTIYRCHLATCPGPPIAAKVSASANTFTDDCNYSDHTCWYEVAANDLIGGKLVTSKPSNIVEAQVK
jgi:hypothetical protein